jgi:hypothetical protein
MWIYAEEIKKFMTQEVDLLKEYDRRNESHFFIKVAICHWHDKNGLHMRKDIRVLSRKSGKSWVDWFDEDCSNSGADLIFKNFEDLEEGTYKVKMRTFKDWETGYVDDWVYETEKI